MEFEPKFYAEQIQVRNPHGHIGVLTLWTPVRTAERWLTDAPWTSHIAAISTFYGNGLTQLIQNLAWNPQITDLVVCGQNLSASLEALQAYFLSPSLSQVQQYGVTWIQAGTYLLPHCLAQRPRLPALHLLSRETIPEAVFMDPAVPSRTRVNLEVPETIPTQLPYNLHLSTISASDVLEAWKNLVYNLYTFGKPIFLPDKGQKKVLYNVTIHLSDPTQLTVPTQFGPTQLDPLTIQNYVTNIFINQQNTETYSYATRFTTFFQEAVQKFRENLYTRKVFTSTWDNSIDREEDRASPCLTGIYLYYDSAIHMIASFRAHNALYAWPYNVYALLDRLTFVADQVKVPVGTLTIQDCSVSLSASDFHHAKNVAEEWEYRSIHLVLDSTGLFIVKRIKNGLVVEHYSTAGILLGSYTGKTPDALTIRLLQKGLVTTTQHALYLGKKLAEAFLQKE